MNRTIAAVCIASLVAGVAIASPFLMSENKPGQVQGNGRKEVRDENFDKMLQVLTHRRCINCHPSDGIPKQGEDSHPHYFSIARGEDNHGFESTRCDTCHQAENNEYSGVPGAPEWSLAPHSMRWEGLSRADIARSILDPQRNGNRTAEQVMHHLTEHALVLWAWEPGVDANGQPRERPPVPKEEYIAAVKKWFDDGTPIPDAPIPDK